MSQASPAKSPSNGAASASSAEDTRPRHEVYKLPAPIRTFPLPTFNPSNPISLLHLAWTWASQVFFPPPAEPSMVWEGVWSPTSRSVHVVDHKAIRALWEQGFYGKGNLSRSEPNWLKREKVRRGLVQSHVSEEMTRSRREERVKMKWERARLEQEVIRQTRLEEAELAAARNRPPSPSVKPTVAPFLASPSAPVGPLELLALPNSLADLVKTPAPISDPVQNVNGASFEVEDTPSPAETPNKDLPAKPLQNGSRNVPNGVDRNGVITGASNGASASDTSDEQKTLKRRKSVRFSPTVESATFDRTDPPSPNHAQLNGGANGSANKSEQASPPSDSASKGSILDEIESGETSAGELVDKEHLQLTAEEAFFLHFGLGCLKVKPPSGKEALETKELFKILRQESVLPPLEEADLRPDDSFLVNYAVYHHFRSLGWVPRPGLKFAMDWMLYAKGPVFDHAEFGVIIMPSYSDPWWKENGKPANGKTWHWLHGVVRVLSHVMKSLVLVYVDVPPPPAFDEALEKGPAEVFKLYRVREVMVKRWSSNRNR